MFERELELTPKDTVIAERGEYIFEIAPDGSNIKRKKATKTLTPEEMVNMSDWLAALAYEIKEREEYGTGF